MFSLIPPRVLFFPSTGAASAHYRMLAPAVALRQAGYAITRAQSDAIPIPDLKVMKPDIIVWEHVLDPARLRYMQQVRDALPKTHMVYQIDDLLWQVPDSNPHKSLFPADAQQRFAAGMQVCHAIVVSSKALAECVKRDMPIGDRPIHVARNFVQQRFINLALAADKAPRGDAKPRIGWSGGISHAADLAILKPVIEATLDTYQWVFLGMAPEGIDDPRLEVHPPVAFHGYAQKLGSLDLDIAVAPLFEHEFNRCKSDLRLLEYAAAGYTSVASPQISYGSADYQVDSNSPADWLGMIEWARDGAGSRHHRRLADSVSAYRTYECVTGLMEWTRAILPPKATPFIPDGDATAPGEQAPAFVGDSYVEAFGQFVHENFRDASWSAPQDYVYIRPGTEVQSRTDPGVLTIGITNSGDYPADGRHSELGGGKVRTIRACCADLTTFRQPLFGGAYAAIPAGMIGRYGLPDEAAYGDTELALLEWSARVWEGGGKLTVDPRVFAWALQPPAALPHERAADAYKHMHAWNPQLAHAQRVQDAAAHRADMRETLDLLVTAEDVTSPPSATYEAWARFNNDLSPAGRAAMLREQDEAQAVGFRPVINVVMVILDPDLDHLRAAVTSLLGQTYARWSFTASLDAATPAQGMDSIVAAIHALFTEHLDHRVNVLTPADGQLAGPGAAQFRAFQYAAEGWVVHLGQDDVLAPYALQEIARAGADPDVALVYADHDSLEGGERRNPHFKTGFNYELLLAQNYVGALAAYRTTAAVQASLLAMLDQAHGYGILLHYLEQSCWKDGAPDRRLIHHIPLVLVSRRDAQPQDALSPERAGQAVIQHLTRTGQQAFVGPHPQAPHWNQVRFLCPERQPKVRIIVPTRDNDEKLAACLQSILGTAYDNYEVIVVQDGLYAKTAKLIARVMEHDRKQQAGRGRGGPAAPDRFRAVKADDETPFNFAKLNNDCARGGDHEYLCFLNDDVVMQEPTWLLDMVGAARRPGVGAVGARLHFPSGQIQHAGVMFDQEAPSGETALHAFIGASPQDQGPHGRAILTGEWDAVTAACMVIAHATFWSAGGFDEAAFPVDYNDVDLCLRLRESGYRNVCVTTAWGIHHTGSTRAQAPHFNKRGRLLAEEALLVERHEHVASLENPNLEHASQLALPVLRPARPWRDARPAGLALVVNPQEGDLAALYAGRDELGFGAMLNGPVLQPVIPHTANVRSIDLRRGVAGVADLQAVLWRLDIGSIVLRGLGLGSVEALGTLVKAAQLSDIMLTYAPHDSEQVCPRRDVRHGDGALCGDLWKDDNLAPCQTCVDTWGSDFGYVSIYGYRLGWQRFLDACSR